MATTFCRIEMGHAHINRIADQFHHLVDVRCRAVAQTHAHTTQPKRRNLKPAFPQLSFFHFQLQEMI